MSSETYIHPEYTIRECNKLDEFAACIELQRTVWKFDEVDLTPMRSYVVSQHSGGFIVGAFDKSDKLLGFAHATPGFDEQDNLFYYSNMAAVLPEFQNSGIGLGLKLAQRNYATKTGIKLITWTFDPLQSRNAHFNINKLGAVIRKYVVNYYGNFSSSALHVGIDTDRLFGDWWVGSKHTYDTLAGIRKTDTPDAIIEIPRYIDSIKERDINEARDIQLKVRTAFQRYLNEGLFCAGFDTDPKSGNSRYLLFKDI